MLRGGNLSSLQCVQAFNLEHDVNIVLFEIESHNTLQFCIEMFNLEHFRTVVNEIIFNMIEITTARVCVKHVSSVVVNKINVFNMVKNESHNISRVCIKAFNLEHVASYKINVLTCSRLKAITHHQFVSKLSISDKVLEMVLNLSDNQQIC